MSTKTQRYAKGLSQGKTKKQSALDAGYAPSTAKNAKKKIEGTKKFQDFNAELKHEIERQGIGPKSIVQSLKQLLNTKKSTFHRGVEVVGTQIDSRSVGKGVEVLAKIMGLYAPVKMETPQRVNFDDVEELPREEVRKILMDLLK